MGLTGIILRVELLLEKIFSKNINQVTIKTDNLKETFEVFENIKNEKYSVAWIDCLSKNSKLGRSHVMYGDFSNDEDLSILKKNKIRIPFSLPSFLLNEFTVKLFNWVYYNRQLKKKRFRKVDFNSFFPFGCHKRLE